MQHPVPMKLIAFNVMSAFSINRKNYSLGSCTSEALLLMFAGKSLTGNEVQSEILIPLNLEGNLSTDIKILVTNDPDIKGMVWIEMLTMADVPISVEIGNDFVWDSKMPFSLN